MEFFDIGQMLRSKVFLLCKRTCNYLLTRYTKNESSLAELEPNFNIWGGIYV